MGEGVASASRDLGEGLNILTLMVTGFAVFYYAGVQVGGGGKVVPVVCGLVGLVGALMVEVALLMLRERRGKKAEDVGRQERMEREREREAKRRMRKKEEEMKRLMEEMAASQPPGVGGEVAEVKEAGGAHEVSADADEPQAEMAVRRRKGKSLKL